MTELHLDAVRRLAFPLLVAVVVNSTGVPAKAQDRSGPIEDVRAPEVFAHFEAFRGGSDEGAIGTGQSYGATIAVPISRRLTTDLDYQASTASRTNSFATELFTYATTRRLIVPSLVYRFGREAVYGFAGGGIGAELGNDIYRNDYRPEVRSPGLGVSPAIASGIVETRTSNCGSSTSWRGGVVVFPTRRVGVRGDAYLAGWHRGTRIAAQWLSIRRGRTDAPRTAVSTGVGDSQLVVGSLPSRDPTVISSRYEPHPSRCRTRFDQFGVGVETELNNGRPRPRVRLWIVDVTWSCMWPKSRRRNRSIVCMRSECGWPWSSSQV